MKEKFLIGNVIVFSVEFKRDGTLEDPTDVTLKIESPSQQVTTFIYGTDSELVRDAQGKYHCDFQPSEVGDWEWRWESTGNAASAIQGYFDVKASNIG